MEQAMSQPTRRVEALAAVSLKLVAVMRRAFPVEGQPVWPAAGLSEQEALQPFFDLLPGFAACWWVPTDRGRATLEKTWQTLSVPPEDREALLALIHGWLRIFEHYQWGKAGVFPCFVPRFGWLDWRKVRWRWPDAPPVPAQYLDDIERAAGLLVPQVLPPVPGDNAGDQPPIQQPTAYLLSWREILNALKVPNDTERRRCVRELNSRYDGPIKFLGQGSQPKVNRDKLLAWWNRLECVWETQGGGNNANASVEGQYDYGRDGVVIPDISGHVQKRRGRKQ
jgi:hypothetical protein